MVETDLAEWLFVSEASRSSALQYESNIVWRTGPREACYHPIASGFADFSLLINDTPLNGGPSSARPHVRSAVLTFYYSCRSGCAFHIELSGPDIV
jgi:hypothetical protein